MTYFIEDKDVLPWDKEQQEAHYLRLLWFFVVSIICHIIVIFFIFYFYTKPNKDPLPPKPITIHLSALTVEKETSIKTPKIMNKIEAITEPNINKSKTKTPKKTPLEKVANRKVISKKYSALEKTSSKLNSNNDKNKKTIESFLKENTSMKDDKESDSKIKTTNKENTEKNSTNKDPTSNIMSNKKNTTEYKTVLENWLAQYKKYPHASKRKRHEGVVVLEFTIDMHGNLISHSIIQNTKYRLLNKAAIKMLKKANPMPAVPQSIRQGQTEFSYRFPIHFSLSEP